jgi:hypothetical protein
MATYEMIDGKRVLVRRTKIFGIFDEDLPEKDETDEQTVDEEVNEDGS